ncbi:MAG: glycosyl hydrolase family 18 protein [Chloroflexaceae bacterium]|nr:glycosyl hydrolase family 18 protein [Chloroflexaceae bacterium]
MKTSFWQRLQTGLFTLIYLTALGVAATLIFEALRMAQQPISAATAPTLTAAAATPSPGSVTMALLPTVALPTPVPTVAATPEPAVVHPKSGRYIAVWLPEYLSPGVLATFEANKDIIDEISPFWYSTDSSGRIFGTRNDALVRTAHENNILVIPTIHNVAGNSAITAVENLLADPQRRARHVQNIVDEVLARNYDGIDIDYEALGPGYRDEFSAFIIDLNQALKAHDKLLTVAVHGKTSDWGGLGGFQDWRVMNEHTDRVRIMTYDYSWRGGSAGPIAPLYWVSAVAEYARSVVDPAKVMIGVPFYGYDWPANGADARALPWSDIEDLISSTGVTVNLLQRNSQGQVDESYFTYRGPNGLRTVWFMTDAGLESKLNLVQETDLGGIAIWQLGYERPEYWQMIRNKMVKDPVLIQRSINPLWPKH